MLAWSIALRYLFSKKSQGAVNIISAVAVAGVAVATAAIVIVLSVFNGFTHLADSRLAAIDPDLKVVPIQGKAWTDGDSLAAIAARVAGVEMAMPVIEERGLLIFGNQQMPVIFKGVPDQYGELVNIDSTVIDGKRQQWYFSEPAALISVGIAVKSTARPGAAVNLYVPRRTGRINPANPSTAFRGQEVAVTGVFQIDQPEYDNQHVFVPLGTARDLLEYQAEATAIEIKLAPDAKPDAVATALADAIGPDAKVLTRAQTEQSAFRMIMVEKWITFLMLAFILVIASFNIVSTLALLVLEKRDNMNTLRALGAPQGLVRGIFMRLGFAISMAGGIAGIALGSVLVLIQQWGHVIKLAGDPSQMSILYYPVKLEPLDLLIVLALTAIIALGASVIAAALVRDRAARVSDRPPISVGA